MYNDTKDGTIENNYKITLNRRTRTNRCTKDVSKLAEVSGETFLSVWNSVNQLLKFLFNL